MPPVHDRAGDVTIKPIETVYAGHRFRSRLEARWAVFFDAMQIRWEYEPQGYIITDPWEDESRAYLPDFFLPGMDLWVEVKGDPAAVDWPLWGCAVDNWSRTRLPDSSLAYSGAEGNGSALVVLGNIPAHTEWVWAHPMLVNRKGVQIGEIYFDPDYDKGFWDIDSELGVFDSSWSGFKGSPYWNLEPDHNGRPYRGYMPMHKHVAMAYRKARQARFEHGDAG